MWENGDAQREAPGLSIRGTNTQRNRVSSQRKVLEYIYIYIVLLFSYGFERIVVKEKTYLEDSDLSSMHTEKKIC